MNWITTAPVYNPASACHRQLPASVFHGRFCYQLLQFRRLGLMPFYRRFTKLWQSLYPPLHQYCQRRSKSSCRRRQLWVPNCKKIFHWWFCCWKVSLFLQFSLDNFLALFRNFFRCSLRLFLILILPLWWSHNWASRPGRLFAAGRYFNLIAAGEFVVGHQLQDLLCANAVLPTLVCFKGKVKRRCVTGNVFMSPWRKHKTFRR